MRMNTTLTCGLLGGLAVSTAAPAAMTGLSYDVVGHELVPGTTTVHVYAEFEADCRLDAVFGNSEYQLALQYTGNASPWHHADGGPTSGDIDPTQFGGDPLLQWDSFVTIGSQNASSNTTFGHIGIDWSAWETGGDLFTEDGAWWVLNPDPMGEPVNGRVLIAQLTTMNVASGSVSFEAGLQWRNAEGVSHQSGHSIMIPVPGAFTLLLVAGGSTRRRRPH